MKHGPGMIVTPCQDQARYHWFTAALTGLQAPEGSYWQPSVGLSPAHNMNEALRQLRPEDEWAWFIGDDHVFGSETLVRLLDREVDVIAPLACSRKPPWPLMHFDQPNTVPDGEGGFIETGLAEYLQYNELPDPDEGPLEVYRTGSAMLVRRHVLDALGDPWFRTTDGMVNEDMDFCARVREAGFKVYIDPAISIGHIGQVIVKPQYRNGVWGLDICHPGAAETHQFLAGGMSEYANLGELQEAGVA